MSNTSENQIWQEISAEQAHGLFNGNLSDAGISEIQIPSGLARDLMVTESAWQIATDPDINPITPYMWGFNNSLFNSEPNDYLSDDRDYFIAGHNGHGINSYGFGIVSRVGNVTIAQQQDFGGVFGDSIEDLAAVNEQIRVWNNGLRTLQQLRQLPANPLLVEFSSFRGFARISEWREQDKEWSIVIDPLESRVQAEMLLIDKDIKHQHLRASVTHLVSLLQDEWRMWQEAFPEAELHASQKQSGDGVVHYLFLSTPTMYLVRKEGKWKWASNEDNEATDGDFQITVNSKFISFFDSCQELGIKLKAKDLNDFRVDGNAASDTSFEFSASDQSFVVNEKSEVSEIVAPTKEIEVFATVDIEEVSESHVVIAVALSRPAFREITGNFKFKFKNIDDAINFLLDKLQLKISVYECEDLENYTKIRVITDFKTSEGYFEQLHVVLKLEDEDMWHTYKGPPIGYRTLDLTEAGDILGS